jgi:Replication-relaxation
MTGKQTSTTSAPETAVARVYTSKYPRPTDGLAYLLFRTTPRDRWLLAMLGEHRLLTAMQIQALCFTRARTMNYRLTQLRELGMLDRFRTLTASWQGAHCYRYILGPRGALLVAASHDLTPKEFGYDHAKLLRQGARPDLAHTIGLHDALVALAARGQVAAWWNQYSCIPLWGDLIRPDAYVVHRDPSSGEEFGFFFEHDTGSEHLPQLAAKAGGYAKYASSYGGHRPILIHLPDAARDYSLHAKLSTLREAAGLPIATAVTTPAERDTAQITELGARLTGPAWRPLGADARLTLTQIPGYFAAQGLKLQHPLLTDRAVRAPIPAAPRLATGH